MPGLFFYEVRTVKVITIAALLAFSTVAGVANAAADIPKTRTQVVAELQEAQAKGLVTIGEQPYPVEVASSSKSRAEVLAELQEAKTTGLITLGEDSEYPVIVHSSDKTRTQVQRELDDYVSSHSTFVEP
ncbi:DUF4148 domain-containing protein [Allopusillimonas ginsengisoli]|uniref:DUF4148 domain-containing protein n=1 Tax=Allopusillimonas ginsengisoli TaxID=453575 RepID=UPI00101F927F|nr:DUF4148 domain-containing protein [Allopusillimonas ginsengisoli]TEA79001.1 DUF4148 domain-containing protein [Allopusillimonas ginsengisoli]